MSDTPQPPLSAGAENFLSAAYARMLRTSIVLSLAAIVVAGVVWNWSSALGLAAGAILACLNFVWLHHGARLTVERMLHPGTASPSQHRVAFSFVGRYIAILAVAYVILKGYPRTRVAFMVGLACPIVAAMCEAVYEAVKIHQTEKI